MKNLWLGLLSLLLLLPIVSADVVVPSYLSLLGIGLVVCLFLGIVLVESVLFWLFANKTFKIKTGFWKSLLIVVVANAVTSLLGSLLLSASISLSFVLTAFLISFLVEWGVYMLFFLKNKGIKMKLLYLSLIANFVSYLLIYLFL
ncbi:MAG: hypothetical protein ABIJ58_03015 [Nanoarchaeota archaeon]